MRFLLGLVLLSCLFLGVHTTQARPGDASDLEGEWQVVELLEEGWKVPAKQVKEYRLIVQDDEMIFKLDGETHKARFKLDPGKSPREIDLTFLDGPEKGKTIPGICRLEKGRLILCLDHSGKGLKARPQELSTKAGDGRGLLTLERVKDK